VYLDGNIFSFRGFGCILVVSPAARNWSQDCGTNRILCHHLELRWALLHASLTFGPAATSEFEEAHHIFELTLSNALDSNADILD
jgi:hypothetical protein